MNRNEQLSGLHFEAPGAGSWKLDSVHFPRPMTQYWQEIHPESFKRGVRHFTEFYGMLLDTLEFQYVNGFGYMSMVPIADELVPERLARAAEVVEHKLWRRQMQEWDERVKPASIKAHRSLLDVDPDALSDDDLAEYLGHCRDHHAKMIVQHMRFTAAAIVPTGDFLAHVGDWTDHSEAHLLGLLRGTAPVSAGASDELRALIDALTQDPVARDLLAGGEAPDAVLIQLRNRDDATGKALSAYLSLVGYRLLDGFDIAEPCAIEHPDALLRAIRAALEETAIQDTDIEDRIADVRRDVPADHQKEFDELLAEARLTYRVRDERGVFSDIWASGIMRRAALAAGRRLAARGLLQEPVHLVDARIGEMRALLTGASEPTAEELASRAQFRATHRAREAPMMLGDPEPEPPDFSALPPPAARIMRATDLALNAVFGSSESAHEPDVLRGLAASRGVYEGSARRISDPSEFDRIAKGDFLVTESTTEAFNILLPLLGAIVTDAGGLLSHSAIVAREYGIPGVVGTRDATARIADGVRLRVDGDQGEVTVLA